MVTVPKRPATEDMASSWEEMVIMFSNNSNGSRATSARRFTALFASLAMGLALAASPAAAAPFAYVLNPASNSNTVSVIDTATHPPSVMATITLPVGSLSFGVAVTPDGKHVYVTSLNSANVFVIRTATNKVVATVPVGSFPLGVAITPDGTQAYVTIGFNAVSVIDTTTHKVVATIPVGAGSYGVAVTPDGTRVYVTNMDPAGTVSVIDTASKTVVATVTVGGEPTGVAVTPDGKHVYVVNDTSNTVSVIRTATNRVVATIPVGLCPFFVAFTPEGHTPTSRMRTPAVFR
jgi:YVTN family beta-propeller protein